MRVIFFIHTYMCTRTSTQNPQGSSTHQSLLSTSLKEFRINKVHVLRLLPQSITPEADKAFKNANAHSEKGKPIINKPVH